MKIPKLYVQAEDTVMIYSKTSENQVQWWLKIEGGDVWRRTRVCVLKTETLGYILHHLFLLSFSQRDAYMSVCVSLSLCVCVCVCVRVSLSVYAIYASLYAGPRLL